jgi:hypothetical protein
MGREGGEVGEVGEVGEDEGDSCEGDNGVAFDLSDFSDLSALSDLLIIHRPEVVFADCRAAQHGHRREPPFPVGGVEPLANQLDLLRRKP